MHHLLQGGSAGVVEGGHLGCHHDRLELFTELVAGVPDFISNVRGRHLPRQSVSNEYQFVCAENDKLAVCHKDPWGLGRADAAEEGVDGVEEGYEVGLALVVVEAKQLPILSTHAVVCGWEGLGGLPLGHVILHGLGDFLLQQLELTQLEGR